MHEPRGKRNFKVTPSYHFYDLLWVPERQSAEAERRDRAQVLMHDRIPFGFRAALAAPHRTHAFLDRPLI